MRRRRLGAIARKETVQIWRDPRSLLIALLMPFMQLILLGYGVSLDIKHVPLCTFDREASQNSQDLLKRFQASDYFEIAAVVSTYRALTNAVDRGDCRVVLVIPPDFTARLNSPGIATVQAIVDATDTNTANIAIGYAQAVVSSFSTSAQLDVTQFQGATIPASRPITMQSRVWFNEELESRNYIIPGVIAIVMALVGAELTSLTIAREWERGTMELLISTPVTPMEVMIGKLAPYFVIGMLDAAICLAFGVWWFGVPFRGTVATLFLATALFLVVVLGIGYLISVYIKSQVGAAQIGLIVTLLPTTLLSGYMFPIDQMPGAVQAVTYLMFARYYVTALKALFLKGSSIIDLAAPLASMAIYAAVIAYLAARAFRKSLD